MKGTWLVLRRPATGAGFARAAPAAAPPADGVGPAVSETTHSRPGARRLPQMLRLSSSHAHWAGAALFFAMSLTPSLYPRPWMVQGVLSGVALALGWGAGGAIRAVIVSLRRPTSSTRSSRGRMALTAFAVGVALWAVLINHQWRVDVGGLMGIDGSAALSQAFELPIAALAGYGLVLLGRVVRAVHRRYVRLVARLAPRPLRGTAYVVVTVMLIAMVADIVIAGRLVTAVNDRMIAADARVDANVLRPASPYRSGSPASLVPWESLGRMGRAFVADGPGVDELRAFAAAPAKTPIRIYAGLASAASDRERAALAVAELERTGGFARDLLIVITPTGTGAVNRHAIAPLEYMHNGDTAAVAIQYSYRPSWAVMAGNQERAERGARALFDAVTARLAREPSATRPRLLLYGESLGAFGSEQLFTGLDDIRAHVDGVLWVGPPRANPLWRALTTGRDEGTPVWRPVYQQGRAVRFGSGGPELSRPDGPWTAPRIAYLQHPSDPVTWWTPDLLFNRPDWMRHPRPPDISTRMPYLPVVTGVQTAVDMVLGGSAPVGHGHIFATEQAEAWALIAPPAEWSHADTTRLVEHLTE